MWNITRRVVEENKKINRLWMPSTNCRKVYPKIYDFVFFLAQWDQDGKELFLDSFSKETFKILKNCFRQKKWIIKNDYANGHDEGYNDKALCSVTASSREDNNFVIFSSIKSINIVPKSKLSIVICWQDKNTSLNFLSMKKSSLANTTHKRRIVKIICVENGQFLPTRRACTSYEIFYHHSRYRYEKLQ